jgi:hypothetical protein
MAAKQQLEELAAFIRAHRSAESNFDILFQKLTEACNAEAAEGGEAAQNGYLNLLQEARDKYAETYRQSKEKGTSAWPEFENFVTHFEKGVTGALHHAA